METASPRTEGTLRAPELTARAVLAGCVLGAALAAANVYTGLKTAYVDGGNITASVLAFAFFSAVGSARRPYSALENNLTQTIASSAAVMSMVTGIAGPVPAMALSGFAFPDWALVVWGAGLGALGIVLALLLRERLIEREALPFPTGTATAEVIAAMGAERGSATRRARTLLGFALAAGLATWLRDGPHPLLPQEILLPGMVLGVDAATLSAGVSLSPVMVGTGMLSGLRAGASMLLGSLCAWLVLAPVAVHGQWVREATHTELVQWLMWPGAALVLSSSLGALLSQGGALVRGARDLVALRSPGRLRMGREALAPSALALVGVASVAGVGVLVLDLGPLSLALSLALSCVLATVCARSAGETDVAPVGTMGGMTQIAFGGTSQVGSLAHGAIVAGDASQTAATLWALKAGARLGASVRHQVLGQLLGALVGAVVVGPVYVIVVRAYGLGTSVMPAPGALSWKATADAVQGGLGAMPRHAPLVALCGLLIGAALTWLATTRVARYVPSPVALGIGFLLPLTFGTALFLGAVVLAVMMRRRPAYADEHAASIGGGLIAGESLVAVVLAALIASGVL